MKTITNHRTISTLLALWVLLPGFLLLSACGGDKGTINTSWTTPESLIFAYPYPGQQEVPPSADGASFFGAPSMKPSLRKSTTDCNW
ncbi:MAG: hypothetical protein R3F47_15645 [Gammaproteobacteria bacterium]